MNHLRRTISPRLTLVTDRLLGNWRAEVKGVTQHGGWCAAYRDCPLEAMHAAITNALSWLSINP